MNVAIIIDNLNGGGAERVAQYLGDYLLGKGIAVYYFLLYESRKDVYKVSGTIVHTGLGDKLAGFGAEKYKDINTLYLCANTIRRLKKQYAIDASVSFMEMCNMLNASSRYKDKIVLTIHTTLSVRKDFSGSLYDKRNIRRICKRADCIVAVSNFVKEDLLDNYGVQKSKTVVIPNTLYKVEGDVNCEKQLVGKKNILSVGRLVGVKQHDRILRAFSYVKEKDSEAKLYVLGTGKNLDYLKYLSQKLGIADSVFYEGFCLDLGNYYKNARALVMASMAEGFPNAMVEAMTYGVPVITTDSPGGCGEIVGKEQSKHGIQYCEYGIITPYIKGKAPRSLELEHEEILLGKAMLEIIQNDDLYERYHEASLKRADYYNYDKVMKMWEELLIALR